MAGVSPSTPRSLSVTILVARIVGTLFVGFLLLMLVGYAVNPQGSGDGGLPDEFVMMLFFPIGMCLGYLIAWRCAITGGIIAVGCMAVFLIGMGEADMVGILSVLGAPGVVLIVCGLLARRYRLGAGDVTEEP